jgi:hypothetical protein
MQRIGLFLPTGKSWHVSMAALAWLGLGVLINVLLYGLRPDWRIDNSLFLLGFFFLPISVLFLSLAVWFERCPAPKFAWGCGTLLLLICAIIMITSGAILSPSFPKGTIPVELVLGLIGIGSPVIMALAIPICVAFPRIHGDLKQRSQEEQARNVEDSKKPAV